MAKNLDRSPSTVQFDKYHGGRCIWGLLPLHLSSFKKFKSHNTRPKHEVHSNYGLKSAPIKTDNVEEYESRRRSSSCNVLVCIGENISSSGGKVIAQPSLKRIHAVHNLEHSSNYLGDLKDLKDSEAEKTVQESNHLPEHNESDHDDGNEYQSSKTCENFFDAFKIDKKLFMKNTRKSDADRCERVLDESWKKVTLLKSGSFPSANKLYGNPQPSKLEDKLTEVWPSGSSTASPFSSSSPSSSTTSSFSSHQSDNIKLLRSHSMLHKLPMDRSVEGKHRRTLSLNGSMERYIQLFETGFRRDLKLNMSTSLSDSSILRKAHSMREALQLERSGSVEFRFPMELSRSETVRSGSYFHEQSDSVVIEDEPGTTGIQNAVDTTLEDICHENVSTTKNIIDLTDLPNALKQLVNLSTIQDQNEIRNELEDQLLSHLVNELMYDIYEESDAYYWPASLGSKCSVHLQPLTEDQVSRKVVSRIRKLRGVVLEAGNEVKSITAHDLVNSYGWMNLQVDAECLGLALEEMLFDELLEELIYE